jgi:DNA (cytosine-5)-methyltransferase 1
VTSEYSPRPAGDPPPPVLRSGSLCTGYGGLDRHAAAVLAARYPHVPNLGDITALDWAAVPPVDLITGGWPCQDISYAGPGAGIKEGTRSGLWLTIAGGLRQLRPSYVFLENVAALRTRGLRTVLADLAALVPAFLSCLGYG